MSAWLEARAIVCGYGGEPVLSGVSLAIRPGEVLAVIGPNGAGKSTLLRVLGRLLRPSEGDVLLRGQSLWSQSPGGVARQIALAPQGTIEVAWPMTVGEIVALGRAPHRGWLLPWTARDRKVARDAMEQLGIAHLATREVSTLSGGEMRRVVLARALAQEPQVLLLDEPAAHLDLHFQAELLEIVRGLARARGLAVVLTVHDFTLGALCADRMALLHGGRLHRVGTPGEVLAPEVLTEVYGNRLEVLAHPASGLPLVVPSRMQRST